MGRFCRGPSLPAEPGLLPPAEPGRAPLELCLPLLEPGLAPLELCLPLLDPGRGTERAIGFSVLTLVGGNCAASSRGSGGTGTLRTYEDLGSWAVNAAFCCWCTAPRSDCDFAWRGAWIGIAADGGGGRLGG